MIGFEDKIYIDDDSTELEKLTQFKTTTEKWIKENPDTYVDKLRALVTHNIAALAATLGYIKTLPETMRMFQLSLDMLPMITHPEYYCIYRDEDFLVNLKSKLLVLGKYARQHGIKLSTRTAPYIVLNSDKADTRTAAIAEIEAHTFIATSMGYGQKKLDFSINTTLTGTGGRKSFQQSFKQLSPTAKLLLTVSNSPYIELAEILTYANEFRLGVVIDLHSYWLNTGKYLSPRDPLLQRVLATWNELRPTLRYSNTREASLDEHSTCNLTQPSLAKLLELGLSVSELRKTSTLLTNVAMNGWVLDFSDDFDILCVAKKHNKAAAILHRMYVGRDTVYANNET